MLKAHTFGWRSQTEKWSLPQYFFALIE